MSPLVVPRWAALAALLSLVSFPLPVPASAVPPAARLERPPATPSANAADDTGAWIALAPGALDGHAAIYDPAGDVVFVFGGTSAAAGAYVNDTWMLTLGDHADWFPVPVDASAVPQRSYASAILDPVGRRMIVFGGDLGGLAYPTSDVHALSLAPPCEWTALMPGGDPGARMMHAAVYDPVRHRMIVFGGTNGYGLFDDAWTLSLGGSPAWDPMSPAGTPPAARYFASATYDPVRDRVIVIGGVAAGGVVLDDVWALDLAGAGTWTHLVPGGAAFGEHCGHVAVYDPSGDRVVVFGGVSNTEYLDDAWALSLAGSPSWSRLSPAGDPAPPLAFHAGAYDSRGDRLVTYGGTGANGFPTCGAWTLSLGASPAWTHRTSPGSLTGHAMTADPERDRAIVFGGVVETGAVTNAAWSLALAGPATWTPLAPAGSPPAPRSQHSAVCDAARDRLIVFGGDDGAWGVFGDTWALSLDGPPAWTPLAPAGTPPAARASHTAILDPVRERMIVFGGRTPSGARQDVWALSLSGSPAWTVLSPTGTPPPPRWNHVAIYDPIGDRMIVHGGESAVQWFGDTWALSLSGTPAWTELSPAGEPPYARTGHHALYDPREPGMVVSGGEYGAACEVWTLDLVGPLEWTLLAPDGRPMAGRTEHQTVYDADRDRMVVFGGSAGGDLWALARSFGAVGVEPTGPAASFPAAWAPNPARGGASLALELPADARVELRLFDISGRRVRAVDFGHREAGAQRFAWDGRGDDGRPLPPGLYFGELRANRLVVRARLAIAR